MAPKSNVVILYKGEEPGKCIWSLRAHQYLEGGWMTVAVNDEILTPTLQPKRYSHYQLFQRVNVYTICGGIDHYTSWIVGSKIGRANSYLPNFHDSQSGAADIMNQLYIHPHDPNEETHIMLPHYTKEEIDVFRERREYSAINLLYHESTRCCTFQSRPALNPFNEYGIPSFGRRITRVREVIYHTTDVEFYLYNGLYFRPDRHKSEEIVLKNGVYADDRVVIRCLDMNRHYIQTVGYSEFLRITTHVELRGYWWSGTVQLLMQKLPSANPNYLNGLTLMNMCTERTPFNTINDYISTEVRGQIKMFNYDCRDTREGSMASIVNGIWKRGLPAKSFKDLDRIFLCAPSMSSPMEARPSFHTDLEHLVRVS
uniref:Uncharacterized protein n=1 Tax=Panagrolaimus superbus TaxID=310955 RepID=A0A914YC20_9BILA